MAEWFEVSAEWMKACGYPAKARTFRVISKQLTWAYDPFFACMYTVDRDGQEWVVAHGRGRLVNEPEPDLIQGR